MSKRRPIVVTGNWKMYKTVSQAAQFVETLAPLICASQVRINLAVPFTAIYPTKELVKKLTASLGVGAQNMNDAQEGAFTGEIAAEMLSEAGADFVVLGHSERRHIFHESNEFIQKKVQRALKEGLPLVLCVGETLEQREKGETESVVKEQLLAGLLDVDEASMEQITLAYEPVWAIGTGKVAEAADAQAVHAFCREQIAEKWGKNVANQMVIQYGGSVNVENAATLIEQPDIDGLLIGGASLKAQTFAKIIDLCEES